ncbi:methylthioribose kinase [Abyssicoccus albus]|uniref:DUF7147 domain-containing protein n=1 Tax=Abyssicoccus albus TaxID=1817405 RepID=A0A3N5BMI9_9BACL|nr:methylthioribose kinase [Abyssicoccus albus]RPF57779.1 hypothetical protein EDD62_0414 [Abyssicoccus albus]
MTQHIIKLGEGYGDLYEIHTLIKHMPDRIQHGIILHSEHPKKNTMHTSLLIVLSPTEIGQFTPIYGSFEGIKYDPTHNSKRVREFIDIVKSNTSVNHIHEFTVKHSDNFASFSQYEHYLIGLFRNYHLLKPLDFNY